MSDKSSSVQRNDHTLVLPAFGKYPALPLDMGKIQEAERRYLEAKDVNPVTYVDLEHTFNESYRDIKRHITSIEHTMRLTEKAIEEAKANVFLDRYPEYLESKGIKGSKDTAQLRNAFLSRDDEYNAALDRLNQLKALLSMFENKLKITENVCRYMRKQMDLIIRSGLSNRDLYITQRKK